LLGLPYLGLIMGFDFSIQFNRLTHHDFQNQLIESQVRGYFRQTLLIWSGFSLAAITVLLAFTRYKLSKDKVALVIGLTVFFSGSIEAIHTLFIDGLDYNLHEKSNIDALIWIFSNTFSGLILIIGLLYLLNSKKDTSIGVMGLLFLALCLAMIGLIVIYLITINSNMPEMWFNNPGVSRPYESISLLTYTILLVFVYPKTYRAYPTILSHCIFYMGITQIITALYFMVLSHTPYDSAYNIAYFLKLVNYFIPCTCLIIHYIFSYAGVLAAQKKLEVKQVELKYIASHDSLTNLFNRREFEELLIKAISNAQRTQTSLALLLIDLDNFKSTNDTFGHLHGDELLKQFSNRLILLIRKGDLLARVGGDEFTLILPQIDFPSSARRLSQRILNELNSPYLINGRLITVTVSIGISIFPTDGTTSEKLLIKADLAMYKAKSSGKNTYQFYTEDLSCLQHRESEIEAHLRKGLQDDEFKLHFQPKYNLVNKEITGAEVLLRWNNKVLGALSPNEFIPVAERSGLIIEIGQWVLSKTCEQLISWSKQFDCTSLCFSVNISPVQLANTQFLSVLKTLLSDLNYPLHNLEFEITETVLIGEDNQITDVLNTISALGIKIALDDFGKGYSSLNRLKTLPIDTLKIDKYFISDINHEKDKVVIVDIIIKLANELGMDIVAEGIETNAQLEYLISKDCTIGQGFLLSEPLPAEDFSRLAFTTKPNKEQRTKIESL
jgi:c-di-GMP phosphodiesterase